MPPGAHRDTGQIERWNERPPSREYVATIPRAPASFQRSCCQAPAISNGRNLLFATEGSTSAPGYTTEPGAAPTVQPLKGSPSETRTGFGPVLRACAAPAGTSIRAAAAAPAAHRVDVLMESPLIVLVEHALSRRGLLRLTAVAGGTGVSPSSAAQSRPGLPGRTRPKGTSSHLPRCPRRRSQRLGRRTGAGRRAAAGRAS